MHCSTHLFIRYPGNANLVAINVSVVSISWFLFKLGCCGRHLELVFALVVASLLCVCVEGAATFYVGAGLAAEVYGGVADGMHWGRRRFGFVANGRQDVPLIQGSLRLPVAIAALTFAGFVALAPLSPFFNAAGVIVTTVVVNKAWRSNFLLGDKLVAPLAGTPPDTPPRSGAGCAYFFFKKCMGHGVQGTHACRGSPLDWLPLVLSCLLHVRIFSLCLFFNLCLVPSLPLSSDFSAMQIVSERVAAVIVVVWGYQAVFGIANM
jgi:hypothetical protein